MYYRKNRRMRRVRCAVNLALTLAPQVIERLDGADCTELVHRLVWDLCRQASACGQVGFEFHEAGPITPTKQAAAKARQ